MTALSPTNSPQSRFQLRNAPLVSPGMCAVCGSTSRPVVDFMLDIFGYGTVYFCVSCLAEAATVIGMINSEEVAAIKSEAAQSLQAYVDQEGLTVVTNEWYNTVSDTIGRLSALDANRVLLSVDETPVGSRTADDPNYATTNGLPKTNARKPRQNNSTSSNEGPASVPASSSDESDAVFNL